MQQKILCKKTDEKYFLKKYRLIIFFYFCFVFLIKLELILKILLYDENDI